MIMRVVSLSFLLIFTFGVLLIVNTFAASGDFDPTFGTNGQVINTIPNTGAARNLALQTDGKIVLASSSFNSNSDFDFAVLRLNSNGTTDNSFGVNGKVIIPFDNFADEEAVAVAVQQDGKILVTGYVEFGSPRWDFGIARLNSDGSLDTTFGTGGKAKIPVSNSDDFPSDFALQTDGKIIIVGKGFNQPNSDAALVRLNTNGTLDTTFNNTGKIVTPIGGGAANDFLSEVKIQTDGKIVVAGSDGSDFAVARFNSNGSFDATFDGDGIAATPVGTQRDEANTVIIQTDGKIVAGGFANSGSSDEAAIVRYNSNGSLDTTFDGDGKTTIDIQPFDSENFKSVVVQTDGKIIGVAVGSGKYNLVRYNSNGSRDSTFGTNGVKIATVDNGQNGPSKAALQPDGRLVVSGIGSTAGFAAVRFLTANNNAARFDYDGDGKSDVSVFRPDNGAWYLQQSTNGFTGFQFGLGTDKIVPADYDGDGKTDVAVYRSGTWYLQRSSLGFTGISFGTSSDVPVPADYDGDGKAEIAVYRPSNGTWYIYNLVTNQTSGVSFGTSEDKPVSADYDGDGKADVAVFRPSNATWYLQRSQAGFTGVQFGAGADKPVPADYDGDGKADVAVYRLGIWYLQRSQLGFTGIQFGIATDLPTPADYDGDGKADVAIFRNGTWYLQRSTQGFAGIAFGAASDQPIPNAFVR